MAPARSRSARELIGAGCAALVHAVVPGWFTETAGQDRDPHLRPYPERKAGAANPDNWPDYEI